MASKVNELAQQPPAAEVIPQSSEAQDTASALDKMIRTLKEKQRPQSPPESVPNTVTTITAEVTKVSQEKRVTFQRPDDTVEEGDDAQGSSDVEEEDGDDDIKGVDEEEEEDGDSVEEGSSQGDGENVVHPGPPTSQQGVPAPAVHSDWEATEAPIWDQYDREPERVPPAQKTAQTVDPEVVFHNQMDAVQKQIEQEESPNFRTRKLIQDDEPEVVKDRSDEVAALTKELADLKVTVKEMDKVRKESNFHHNVMMGAAVVVGAMAGYVFASSNEEKGWFC